MFRRIARWLALLCAWSAMSSSALAQSLDPECPRSLVVGSPAGSSAFRASLPTGTLRVAWRRTIGPSIEHAPLVTADGKILVFTVRGDLVELDEEGAEEGRVGIFVGPLGPGAILSDGTVVTVDMAGGAVGGLGSPLRFRTRVGDRGVVVKPAPLALDDGGVVVANGVKSGASDRWTSEIMALDAEGRVRARA